VGKAIQGGTINVYDLPGSPKIRAGRDTRESDRRVTFDWASIDALISELFPVAPALPGAYPGVSYLYADTATFGTNSPDPMPSCGGSVATYSGSESGMAEIQYRTLSYDGEDADPSDLLSRRYSIGGEFMSLPSNQVRWEYQAPGETVQQEDISAGQVIPTIEHVISFHRLTSIPFAAIRANVGHLNDGVFEGAEDGCLMYLGAEIGFKLSTDGSISWTLEHRFSERAIDIANTTGAPLPQTYYGWNYFRGPKGWWRLLDEDSSELYPSSATFADLIS
jgi:hypothetical protein